MTAILIQHGLNLIALLGLFLIAVGLGRLVLFNISLSGASSGEDFIFGAGVGLGILSCAIFILGATQILYPSTVYLLLGISGIFSFFGWRVRPVGLNRTAPKKLKHTAVDVFIGSLLLISLLLGLLLVLTPAIGNDVLTYHLGAPKLYLQHHGFYLIPGNLCSNYPLNAEMLYIIGLLLGGDTVAKGIHFGMALLTLMGMVQFARHLVPGAIYISISLLVFYSIPSVFVNSHMAYVDLALTFYIFLSVYAFLNWFLRKQIQWLVICGVFTGFSAATKYSALLLPFMGCLGILYVSRRRENHNRQAFQFLGVYLFSVLVVGSPFYIKNWVLTGNPLYPFLYSILGGAGWDMELSRQYDLFLNSLGMGRGLLDYLLLPWNVSFHAKMNSPVFDGILGPLFILTLPFAIWIRNTPAALKIAMAYCGITFLFWIASVHQIRYLIPIFPLLSIMVGYVLKYYRRKNVLLFSVLLTIVAGGLGFNGYHIFKDFQIISPVQVFTGRESRNAFLDRMIPSHGMFQYINTHLPENARIFFIYMKNPGYLCDRAYYSDSVMESHTMEKILSGATKPGQVYKHLKNRGSTHILYDIRYVFGDRSPFSYRNRELFLAFQTKHLKLIKTDKERYYLFALVPQQGTD
jgi:hypothetical protein